MLGATGPITAADDIGRFSMNPQTQHSFNDHDYRQLGESATSVDRHRSGNLFALWITRIVFSHFDVKDVQPGAVNESGLITDSGLFVVRQGWVGKKDRSFTTDRFRGNP